MKSIKELYKIGSGPSSSHTMGPKFAAEKFFADNFDAIRFKVTLFGSLGATGKGHLTDIAIYKVLGKDKTTIVWSADKSLPEHPNALRFEAINTQGNTTSEETYFSVGGGSVRTTKILNSPEINIYPRTGIANIMHYCTTKGIAYWEYVVDYEGDEILIYLQSVWNYMRDAIIRGLSTQGVLPGSIGLRRQAWNYYQRTKTASGELQQTGTLTAYALATAEENSGGGTIVTAPTCGACGILPAILKFLQDRYSLNDSEIVCALATAGLFGNIIKHNASISGAEVGCQGEVGSACAMAAAAACQLLGGSLRQIEYAAEMGIEHHLGLTCDPVDGLVQIPCIERNAYAATRAISCAEMAILSDGSHHISFDEVIAVMMQTGKDLPSPYRETSKGGLARIVASRQGTPSDMTNLQKK